MSCIRVIAVLTTAVLLPDPLTCPRQTKGNMPSIEGSALFPDLTCAKILVPSQAISFQSISQQGTERFGDEL